MNDIVVENLDLKKPTSSERIWLWRRRQHSTTGRTKGRGGSRMSANEAAALLRVSLETYMTAESGHDDGFAEQEVWEAVRAISGSSVAVVTGAELCALARRRSRASVEEICQALGGISKPTYFARERSGDPGLIDLWRARGYTM